MESVLLESSVRAALMFAAMAAVLAVFRVQGAAARHAAWAAVLVTMLLLPVWAAWGPDVPLRVLPAVEQQAELSLPNFPQAVVPMPAAAVAQPVASPAESSWAWPEAALGFYFVVSLGMFARLWIGTMRARRITSVQCSAPVTVGWIRPVILLPAESAGWTGAQRDAVMLHEQEHVRRRDPLVQWLAQLNCCVFWFHPAAWWLEHNLSLLAEEACDDAVLAGGHSPKQYSAYLIDLAKTVHLSGARVAVHFAYGDRTLARRVERILQGAPAEGLTRNRTVALILACLAVLAAFTACTLNRGEPTMSELRNRRGKETQEMLARQKAIAAEVAAMTPEQAQLLEEKLKTNPDDSGSYARMIGYYYRVGNLPKLNALYLWTIEHAPEAKGRAAYINPESDRAEYEQGKRIWSAHLKKPNPSAEIYNQAAIYFSWADLPLAEATLLEAKRSFPAAEWSGQLASVYVKAMKAGGLFGERTRARLEASNDVKLLVQMSNYSQRSGTAAAFEAAQHYLDRALELQPDSLPALTQRVVLEEYRAVVKARSVPADQLSVSERIHALRRKLYGPPAKVEPIARELLQLAEANPTDPEYGNAVFSANQLLGEAALARNDKRAAVQFLRASMTAPVTDRLRYWMIDMTLARDLVDWGERTAVAEFLEHCAKFSQSLPGAYKHADWAAQIRAGKNPELAPMHSF